MKRERGKITLIFQKVRWYNENMITGYGVAW